MKKSSGDANSREGSSSVGLGKETTASDHNSVRRSVTVWDLQFEKERKLRHRNSSGSMRISDHFPEADRLFMVSNPDIRLSAREYNYTSSSNRNAPDRQLYTGGASPRVSQGLIPGWTLHQPVITRSNSITRSPSITRSSSLILNSPTSKRKPHLAPDDMSDVGGFTPRFTPGSQSMHSFGIPSSASVRSMRTVSPNFSDSQRQQHTMRYGSRRTVESYPSRSTRW